MLGTVGVALFHFEFERSTQTMQQFLPQITMQADRVFPRFIARQLPSGMPGLLLAAIWQRRCRPGFRHQFDLHSFDDRRRQTI